jgi:hypothetical protein
MFSRKSNGTNKLSRKQNNLQMLGRKSPKMNLKNTPNLESFMEEQTEKNKKQKGYLEK